MPARLLSLLGAAALIAICGLAALTGAGCRQRNAPQVSYTYHKAAVTDQQLTYDEQTLKDTSGVSNVITHNSDKSGATIELYLDADNQSPGRDKAAQLGYTVVKTN